MGIDALIVHLSNKSCTSFNLLGRMLLHASLVNKYAFKFFVQFKVGNYSKVLQNCNTLIFTFEFK
jgi:hypothetical protein